MMRRKRKPEPEKLSEQMERKVSKRSQNTPQYDGTSQVVSTGSTLLDLAISGGRFKEGGIPTGILVEVFGPSGAGKTVLLCQIAGNVQRLGGKIMFHDPEARLNKQFASMFGLDPEAIEYTIPNTVPEVFQSLRDWIPDDPDNQLYGVFADSLAALSTDMEMTKEEGDKMGMRRAKEFSEELRKTCRIITQKNVLVVCSNQIRQNPDAGPYGQKYKTPGGEAIGFYSSLRLQCRNPETIKLKRKIKGKDHERIIGVKTEIFVAKSSVWKPFRTADVYILFDYGIDDIRANLRYLKEVTGSSVYHVGNMKLSNKLEDAIREVEDGGLEQKLKAEVIELWNEIEAKFKQPRKPREWV